MRTGAIVAQVEREDICVCINSRMKISNKGEKRKMNYEYKFEKIKLRGTWWTKKPNRDYHDIIAKHAEDG